MKFRAERPLQSGTLERHAVGGARLTAFDKRGCATRLIWQREFCSLRWDRTTRFEIWADAREETPVTTVADLGCTSAATGS